MVINNKKINYILILTVMIKNNNHSINIIISYNII